MLFPFSLPFPPSQVIQWCTHHKDDPPPPEDDENKEKRTDDIPVWDQEFLKVDQGTLFELILVCAYHPPLPLTHRNSLTPAHIQSGSVSGREFRQWLS